MQSVNPPVQTGNNYNAGPNSGFGDDHFEKILAPHLSAGEKARLKEGLEQFFPNSFGKEINYDKFYQDDLDQFFKQADLIAEIRSPSWDANQRRYETFYTDAVLLSNTCDINPENQRKTNVKQCLFAPIISLSEYLLDLKNSGYTSSQIQAIEIDIRRQRITNILYLPPYQKDNSGFIALLDSIFQFPTPELNMLLSNISAEKIKSLSNFGFYLVIFKLSYHLCRLPEERDR